MAELPFVDEHSTIVERGLDTTWRAVLDVAGRAAPGRRSELVARALGCEDSAAGGPRPLAEGSTIAGFHVAVARPGRELRLEGRHRFSRYALVFHLDSLEASRSRVRAETRAVFPGIRGRIYRALVIGTKGHVFAVRGLLRAIERRAEDPAASARQQP
jgi:hypothetical protein